MWYEIAHVCGHTEDVQIYGSNVHGERERRAARLASQPCYACKKTAETKAAIEYARANGFCVDMVGSEKQVSWAQVLLVSRAKEVKEYIGVSTIKTNDPDVLKQMIDTARKDLGFEFKTNEEPEQDDGSVNFRYLNEFNKSFKSAMWSAFINFANTKPAKFWIDTRDELMPIFWANNLVEIKKGFNGKE